MPGMKTPRLTSTHLPRTDNAGETRPVGTLNESTVPAGTATDQTIASNFNAVSTADLYRTHADHSSYTSPPSLDEFLDHVKTDVQEIRRIRSEYKNIDEKDNSEYDAKAIIIAKNFAQSWGDKPWDEQAVIEHLHDCVRQVHPDHEAIYSEQTEQKHREAKLKQEIFTDHILMTEQDVINFLKVSQETSSLELYDTVIKRHIEKSSDGITTYNTRVDGHLVTAARMTLTKNKSVGKQPLVQTNIVRTFALYTSEHSTESDPRYYTYNKLRASQKAMTNTLNTIANRLLNGEFSDQKEAIDLLAHYKLINSLIFSIEGMKGTQFKNIIKLNYLVDKIKKKYPEKINKALRMPYRHSNSQLKNSGMQNPEIAVVFTSAKQFLSVEKAQIQQSLRPAHWRTMFSPSTGRKR